LNRPEDFDNDPALPSEEFAAIDKLVGPDKREELQVLALELNDATDDLNDAIRRTEAGAREAGLPPASLPVDGGTLAWNGRILTWNGNPLLNASRDVRCEASGHLWHLFGLKLPEGE
jgi:hypothetical protein